MKTSLQTLVAAWVHTEDRVVTPGSFLQDELEGEGERVMWGWGFESLFLKLALGGQGVSSL